MDYSDLLVNRKRSYIKTHPFFLVLIFIHVTTWFRTISSCVRLTLRTIDVADVQFLTLLGVRFTNSNLFNCLQKKVVEQFCFKCPHHFARSEHSSQYLSYFVQNHGWSEDGRQYALHELAEAARLLSIRLPTVFPILVKSNTSPRIRIPALHDSPKVSS